MLDPHLVRRVKDLLARGWKQREIARATGASRASVQRIQHGTRRGRDGDLEPDQAGAPSESLVLQFTAEHQARYEEIHRRKVASDPRAA